MTKLMTFAATATIAIAALAAPAYADTFALSYEAPGVQNTTESLLFSGVETFDAAPTGAGETLSTDFGGSAVSGTYSGINVIPANEYGGAGGTGNYATTSNNASFTLDLATTRPEGINYFGFWLSALDASNVVTFSRGGTDVYTLTAADISPTVTGNPAYYGNPNGGADAGEAFVFVNFHDTDGTFDRVTFASNDGSGALETDNHTVGFLQTSAVPEPATWATMIGGIGLAGGMLRRRRPALATV